MRLPDPDHASAHLHGHDSACGALIACVRLDKTAQKTEQLELVPTTDQKTEVRLPTQGQRDARLTIDSAPKTKALTAGRIA